MPKLGFLIKRIRYLDYEAMFKAVDEVHKSSHKPKLFILADMIYCGFKYGASPYDYKIFGFEELNGAQRSTFVTRSRAYDLDHLLNDPDAKHFVNNKFEFLKEYKDFVKRKWINVDEAEFEDFKHLIGDAESIMLKPIDEAGGKGIEKLKRKDFESLEAMFDYVKKSGKKLAEEVIIQHPVLNEIYPKSLNTCRLVTVLGEKGPHIMYAIIRIGSHGMEIDNISSGGMYCPIDVETGVIIGPGCDYNVNTYVTHPDTGVKLEGIQIPKWDEVKALVNEATKVHPELALLGWDVAISEKDVQLIEANDYPGNEPMQMKGHVKGTKQGILPEYRKYVKGI